MALIRKKEIPFTVGVSAGSLRKNAIDVFLNGVENLCENCIGLTLFLYTLQ